MSNSALLVLDVQENILPRIGDRAETFVASVRKAVDVAHENNIQVIFGVVGFSSSFVEASARNKSFSVMREEKPVGMINPVSFIEPIAGDFVFTKRRVSAFTGSDLEVIVRSNDIDTLVLTGIATSGVILSTVREAADKDYKLIVISDLCADADDEVHNVLVNKVFPRQADVITFDEWQKKIPLS